MDATENITCSANGAGENSDHKVAGLENEYQG